MRGYSEALWVLVGWICLGAGGCASLPWGAGFLPARSAEGLGATQQAKFPSEASRQPASHPRATEGEIAGRCFPNRPLVTASPKEKDLQANLPSGQPGQRGNESTPGPSRDSAGPTAQELHALMEELQQLALLDPQAQQLLMEDLSKTHPSLWKPLLERFRLALEYHRRLQQLNRSEQGADPLAAQTTSDQTPSAHAPSSPFGEKTEPSLGAESMREKSREFSSLPKTPPSNEQALPTKNPQSPTRVKASGGHVAEQGEESPHHGDPVGGSKLPPPAPATSSANGPMSSWVVSSHGFGSSTSKHPPGQASPASAVEPQPQPTSLSSFFSSCSASPGLGGASKGGDWQARLAALLPDIHRALSPSPQTDQEIAQHVYYRLLCLIAGRREQALEPIPGVPPAMQDFWVNQLYAMQLLLDPQQIPDRPQRAAEAKRLFQEATSKLAIAAPLVLKGLAFATEVQSFGSYRGFDKYEFSPGQELLLYAEVENFQSEPTPKGYHTKLRSRYQILNAAGVPVAEQEFPVTEEYCRRMRRDFFIAYPVQLPADLQPGRYTLKLSLEDLYRGQVCQSSVDFTIRKANP